MPPPPRSVRRGSGRCKLVDLSLNFRPIALGRLIPEVCQAEPPRGGQADAIEHTRIEIDQQQTAAHADELGLEDAEESGLTGEFANLPGHLGVYLRGDETDADAETPRVLKHFP